MLELRPACECCGAPLPADRAGALICSFECTFCETCATNTLSGICPNCKGALVPRPIRSTAQLAQHPATRERKVSPAGCGSSEVAHDPG